MSSYRDIIETAHNVHGGRDVCYFRDDPDPYNSEGINSYYGRALDNSPDPQDFGWWRPVAREGRRRLNLKTDDSPPELVAVDHSMLACSVSQRLGALPIYC